MATVFFLGCGILAFLILAVLIPLVFFGGDYRHWRARYPSVKTSFVLYTVAFEGAALVLLEFVIVFSFDRDIGLGTSPLPPDVRLWLNVAFIALIVLVASAMVAALVLDPRHKRGGRE